MLKVEVNRDGYAKYHPVITVKLWNVVTVWRAWSSYRSPAWISPFTLRFHPIRFKQCQLPHDWPEKYATSYFLLITFWELGMCDMPDKAHIRLEESGEPEE
jgi:hypothetical protein